MKKYILFFCLIPALSARAQLVVTPQLPQSGIIQKNQLWNLLVTNTSPNGMNVTITMQITSVATGEEILTASTGSIALSPGNNMLNSTLLMPIQYNMMGSSYSIDPGLNDFLPAGNFTVCYIFNPDKPAPAPLAQVCNEIDVQPLAPVQLTSPEDDAVIDSNTVSRFTWIPPAPQNLFTNLSYDFYLVAVDSGQTPSEAIQNNIPLLYQPDVTYNFLMYPASAPGLQTGIKYAWQVIAKNNESSVSKSEAWSFTLQSSKKDSLVFRALPYTRLQKTEGAGYSISPGIVKFAYINETADTTWNVQVMDISGGHTAVTALDMDSIKLKRGLNLVQVSLAGNSFFNDKHIYLLTVRNSRNEAWKMKFEYVKP